MDSNHLYFGFPCWSLTHVSSKDPKAKAKAKAKVTRRLPHDSIKSAMTLLFFQVVPRAGFDDIKSRFKIAGLEIELSHLMTLNLRPAGVQRA